jgi:DNA-binding response OmpR family regulator
MLHCNWRPQADRDLPPKAMPDSPRIRVLVIDPDPSFVTQVTTILHDEGHEVDSSPDFDRGLTAGARTGPDLVLLTVGRDGERGAPPIDRLRESSWGSSCILVAVLQNPDDFTHASRALAGAKLYLMKPVSPDVLRMAVQLAQTSTGSSRDEAAAGRLPS